MTEPTGKQKPKSSACPLVSCMESGAVKQVHHTAEAHNEPQRSSLHAQHFSTAKVTVDRSVLCGLNTWGFYTLMSFTWQMTCVYKAHLAGPETHGSEPRESGPDFYRRWKKPLWGKGVSNGAGLCQSVISAVLDVQGTPVTAGKVYHMLMRFLQ